MSSEFSLYTENREKRFSVTRIRACENIRGMIEEERRKTGKPNAGEEWMAKYGRHGGVKHGR